MIRLIPAILFVALAGAVMLVVTFPRPAPAATGSYSLRFYGSGVHDIDRVKIALEGRSVNVGAGDFTIELWLRALPGENAAPACAAEDRAWIYGNILIDRDVFDSGDYGDYGIALRGGRLVFGVSRGASEAAICGSSQVDDGAWHHIAVTRHADSGALRIFVDGKLDASGNGPSGDISYRAGRATSHAADPFLVIGAEKHDAGPEYPSFSGWIDELRFSTVLRYAAPFSPPGGPFSPDESTAALYHFDEGQGDQAVDSAITPGERSHGRLRFGGRPGGPEGPAWSPETPWQDPAPTASPTPGAGPSATARASATRTPTPSPAPTTPVPTTPVPTTTPTAPAPAPSAGGLIFLPGLSGP